MGTVTGLADKRDRLNTLLKLLSGDLDFHGQDSSYASHNFHAFAAKFPPQLPRAFIMDLTEPGGTVLDPMMGSGTAVVEAMLSGRTAIGFDIDPLAVMLCQVKVLSLDVTRLHRIAQQVLTEATVLVNSDVVAEALASRFDLESKKFIDYWFLPQTQRELMALILGIECVVGKLDGDVGEGAAPDPVRDFLKVAFSSIIITKSGGVSLARDLAHSRPHRDLSKAPRSALVQFAQRLRKNVQSLAEIPDVEAPVRVAVSDARTLPLPTASVDLVVTSPPYANALDYVRAHKFSLVWLGKRIDQLTALRATYIGAEKWRGAPGRPLPGLVEDTVAHLAARDAGKARVLQQYCGDMSQALAEMHRVLRPGSACIVVVGTSTMRGLDVQTHTCLAEIGQSVGFQLVGLVPRRLDRDRRLMPARFGGQSASVIEQRMHEEYVIGLHKSAV